MIPFICVQKKGPTGFDIRPGGSSKLSHNGQEGVPECMGKYGHVSVGCRVL